MTHILFTFGRKFRSIQTYTETCQTSKMTVFAELVLTFSFLLFAQKAHLRCFLRFSAHFCSRQKLAEKTESQMWSGFEYVFAAIDYLQKDSS